MTPSTNTPRYPWPLILIAAAMVLLTGLAALLCLAYVVQRFSYYRTTAFAMSPNINRGDIFFVDHFAYDASSKPRPGDVIAFSGNPRRYRSDGEPERQARMMIGTDPAAPDIFV